MAIFDETYLQNYIAGDLKVQATRVPAETVKEFKGIAVNAQAQIRNQTMELSGS